MTLRQHDYAAKAKSLIEHVYNHLPESGNQGLQEAVNLALWSLLVKSASLPAAVHFGHVKSSYKVKSHIERAVRGALPTYYLKNRATRRELNPELSFPYSEQWIIAAYLQRTAA